MEDALFSKVSDAILAIPVPKPDRLISFAWTSDSDEVFISADAQIVNALAKTGVFLSKVPAGPGQYRLTFDPLYDLSKATRYLKAVVDAVNQILLDQADHNEETANASK